MDDGKSTLVGRLLFDTNSVLTDTLDHVEQVSKRRGLDRADLALLTDGLRAEREQGITIDVAYRYFATPARKFILADCPGHVQYTRNTVTGSSTADVIVLLVDARNGVVEQTRRHLAVASLLRVPHVVLVVNKIDLVDYAEDVFWSVATDFALLARSLGVLDTHCIPVSATEGDNVVTRSTRTPWYDGPTVLGYLENVDDRPLALGSEFRFPVQHVVRPQSAAPAPWAARAPKVDGDYRGYAGKIESGRVRVGEEIVVLPRGSHAVVEAIDTPDGPLEVAGAGQSVVLRLAQDVDVSRGDILAATDAPPAPVRDITATVCWLAERELARRRPGAGPARHLGDQGHRQGDRERARPGLRGRRGARLGADQHAPAQRHRQGPARPGLAAADRPLQGAPDDRRLHPRRRGRRLDPGRGHGRNHADAHRRPRPTNDRTTGK